MAKKTLPQGIVNPFSPEFLETWDLWKEYRRQEHGFKYKGLISEQARLMELCTLAGGDEYRAIEIIKQSISNTWKGFFPLKNKVNGHEQPSTKTGTTDFRRSVQAELESRIAGRG